MATAARPKSRSRNAAIGAPVALGRCSAITIQRFWLPISTQQTITPRVPNTRRIGKVPGWAGRRACGLHTSVCYNARERGRSCPNAWAFLVQERVGPKVRADPHQSPSSSCDEGSWKRGRNA